MKKNYNGKDPQSMIFCPLLGEKFLEDQRFLIRSREDKKEIEEKIRDTKIQRNLSILEELQETEREPSAAIFSTIQSLQSLGVSEATVGDKFYSM